MLRRQESLMAHHAVTASFSVLLAAAPALAQQRVATAAGLDFHSSFWMNLHHRLHADARDKKGRVDVSGWPAGERVAWMDAIELYVGDLAQRDLRTGKDMTRISGRLSGANDSRIGWSKAECSGSPTCGPAGSTTT